MLNPADFALECSIRAARYHFYPSVFGSAGIFSINFTSGSSAAEALSRAWNFFAVERRRVSTELTASL
jgi:hypothetical protein